MSSIVLTDSEISTINYFLEGIADIQFVEGVCLSTRRADEQSEEGQILDILFFYNYNPYDSQDKDSPNSEFGTLNLAADQEKLRSVFSEADLSDEDRICLNEIDSVNLSLRMANVAQVCSIYELVNSTILFDRYGAIEQIKSKALSNEKLRTDLVESVPSIENIDRILGDGMGAK